MVRHVETQSQINTDESSDTSTKTNLETQHEMTQTHLGDKNGYSDSGSTELVSDCFGDTQRLVPPSLGLSRTLSHLSSLLLSLLLLLLLLVVVVVTCCCCCCCNAFAGES